MSEAFRPLHGVTVVTLEHAVAGPFCTRQLADLGARVIKVERPGSGDFARGYDERVRGLASHFVWTNRSKESLTLDVKHPEARAILGKLVAGADVLVQNLAPGAAARLGMLDVERQALLRAIRPHEVGGEAAHALVVATREVAHAWPLDLDDARPEVGELPRRERCSDCVLERDDGDAGQRSHWTSSAVATMFCAPS